MLSKKKETLNRSILKVLTRTFIGIILLIKKNSFYKNVFRIDSYCDFQEFSMFEEAHNLSYLVTKN